MWWMLVVGYVVGEGAWMPNLFLLNLANLLLIVIVRRLENEFRQLRSHSLGR